MTDKEAYNLYVDLMKAHDERFVTWEVWQKESTQEVEESDYDNK